MHNHTKDQIQTSREKLLKVFSVLNSHVIGHEEYSRALMLGLVAKEHVVLISPPGTAKSYMVHLLSRLLNAKFYKYLLTKFTDYSELFGTVDVSSLANGQYKRNWSAIVSSEIVFLDEVFKANSAILNSLLSMMQERIVYDPMTGQAVQVELWTMVGASNEVPSEEELQALYDRFSIRVFSDYLSDDVMLLRALEARWLGNSDDVKPIASMKDVEVLHSYAVKLLTMKVKQLGEPLYKIYHVNAVPLIKSLRTKGVLVSDRTIIEKFPKLYASYLALFGVNMDNIMNAVYDLLPYLAQDRSQLNDIRKVIEESLGEVAELANKFEEARKMIRGGHLRAALEKLEEILSFDISKLTSKPWLKPRAEAILKLAREYHQKVQEQLKACEKLAESG